MLLESVSITDDEFLLFKKLTYGLLGINLSEQKRALVVSRLSSRIRDLNLSTFMDYLVYLNKNDANALSELTIFINKITTNETFFFREKHHFDVLVNELFLKKNHSSILRIWSAGCSSGEEPYSIAMKAFEHFKTNTKVKILATDVNTEVLNIAKTGIYNKNSIERNIKFNEISSFFDFIDNETVKVNDKIKSMITFKQLNFLESKYPIKEKLDLIFFRNVMIYFDKETREKIINKFADYLCEDGLLIIGHSENISFLTERFELLDTTTYRKVK